MKTFLFLVTLVPVSIIIVANVGYLVGHYQEKKMRDKR